MIAIRFTTASVWLLALGWIWKAAEWIVCFRRVPDLTRSGLKAKYDGKVSDLPDITVIVPACNEEKSLEASIRSLLASEGVSVQIVVVNDRSTDRTGEVAEAVRQEFNAKALEVGSSRSSFDVLTIEQLPNGWLGKPHALATAAKIALSDWILFTDGDVLFAPHALSRALQLAERESADHLVLLPTWIMSTFAEAAMHGAMHALGTWSLRMWKIADPKAQEFIGVGAFNLTRRATYEALGGFTALKMEVLEDLRFGWMVKRAGYRQRVAVGPGLISLRWAEGAWGVVGNLEKNLFALYRYRTPILLVACGGLIVQIVLPIVALWIGGWAAAGSLAMYGALLALFWAGRRFTLVSPLCVLAYPFAVALFLLAHLRSFGLAMLRGGVMWRGTRYSLEELRLNAGRFW